MGQIASRGQLRMSFVRWALFTVPLIELLGIISSRIGNSGFANPWFAALRMPELMPPGAVFGIAWTILYALMGLSLAMILAARGARGRGLAIALFAIQLAINLAWSPVFFAAHQIRIAFVLILLMLLFAALATWRFARIRPLAAALMLPYLAWLMFASVLNYQFIGLNPDAETLAPGRARTQIGG
jgi:benzodiazapine receptor